MEIFQWTIGELGYLLIYHKFFSYVYSMIRRTLTDHKCHVITCALLTIVNQLRSPRIAGHF